MRVLHITNNFPTSRFPIFGIFVKEQIDSLTDLGLKNEIFFINGREKGKYEYIWSIYRLRRLLKKEKYDIIHCHHAFSAICFILSGYSDVNRSIVSYQNDPEHEQGLHVYNFIKRYIDIILLKNNSIIINNKDVIYLPNGVNIDFFRPIERNEACNKLNLDKSKIYVLFVSSNYDREQKRYDKFCRVIDTLKSKYNLIDVEELKLINIQRDLVPYYFNAASLHLLTSDFEGSPNSVKEAMSCNIPVVATDVGNVNELLADAKVSYAAIKNTVEELSELAYKALTCKEKNNNNRDIIIKKKLDINSVAENINKLYLSLL